MSREYFYDEAPSSSASRVDLLTPDGGDGPWDGIYDDSEFPLPPRPASSSVSAFREQFSRGLAASESRRELVANFPDGIPAEARARLNSRAVVAGPSSGGDYTYDEELERRLEEQIVDGSQESYGEASMSVAGPSNDTSTRAGRSTSNYIAPTTGWSAEHEPQSNQASTSAYASLPPSTWSPPPSPLPPSWNAYNPHTPVSPTHDPRHHWANNVYNPPDPQPYTHILQPETVPLPPMPPGVGHAWTRPGCLLPEMNDDEWVRAAEERGLVRPEGAAQADGCSPWDRLVSAPSALASSSTSAAAATTASSSTSAAAPAASSSSSATTGTSAPRRQLASMSTARPPFRLACMSARRPPRTPPRTKKRKPDASSGRAGPPTKRQRNNAREDMSATGPSSTIPKLEPHENADDVEIIDFTLGSPSTPAPGPTTTLPKSEPEATTTSKPPVKSDPLSEYTCPICFSPPAHAALTPCGHVCCGECLFAAVKSASARARAAGAGQREPNVPRCPVCRAILKGWDGRGGGVIGLKPRTFIAL